MSDHQDQRRLEERRLPHELTHCESMLAGVSLPPSQLSRDELFYRAGWAAAESQAVASTDRARPGDPSTKSISRARAYAWSLASATVAAALAVLLTLELTTIGPLPLREDREFTSAAEGDLKAKPSTTGQDTRPNLTPWQSRPVVQNIRRDWSGPLLMMRDRALLQRWDDPWAVAEGAYSSARPAGVSAQEPTLRGLLQELLPEASPIGS